jgi:alpha-1,3-mannosyl-glycoprotein beta-1,2-N-acetylglucosaminyltransferase
LEYQDRGVQLIKQPDISPPVVEPGHQSFVGYYKISRHYKFALSQIFDKMRFSSVVIVEDDLDIAPDFYEYFLAGEKLLNEDPSLWCITAWNDNGKASQVSDPTRLYRTDFFGGLGWMMHRSLWNELGSKWPKAFWDDWMRDKPQRKDRSSIRPEVSRTKTFGRVGVSQGQFYDTHLKFIKLNSSPIPFSSQDLSYLHKKAYDSAFVKEVYETSKHVSFLEFSAEPSPSEDTYRIEYKDIAEFARIAKELDAMSDEKAGVPRTAYMGVVTLWHKYRRVHVAPRLPWRGY